jgi:hypothetical protein
MYGIKISLGCRLEKNVLSGRGKVGLYGSLGCRPMSYGLYLAFLGIVKFECLISIIFKFGVKLF